MNKEEILKRVVETFCEVFDDDDIELSYNTNSDDVDGWDSIMHITIISELENVFDIQFDMEEIEKLKNIGRIVETISNCLEKSY